MTEASYTAWDGNLYEWPPPDGWYQAADGKWWPEGYGPSDSEQGLPSADGGSDTIGGPGRSDAVTSIMGAGGVGTSESSTSGSGQDTEAQSSDYDDLPNIDDVFGGSDPYADDAREAASLGEEPSTDTAGQVDPGIEGPPNGTRQQQDLANIGVFGDADRASLDDLPPPEEHETEGDTNGFDNPGNRADVVDVGDEQSVDPDHRQVADRGGFDEPRPDGPGFGLLINNDHGAETIPVGGYTPVGGGVPSGDLDQIPSEAQPNIGIEGDRETLHSGAGSGYGDAQDGNQLLGDLDGLQSNEPGEGYGPGPSSDAVQLEARPVWPLAVAGICVALLVALLVAYLLLRDGVDAEATAAAPDVTATGLGSISEPYEFGTGVVVFYDADGEQRRWVVQVLSPVTDGSGQLAAATDEPIPEGQLLAVSRVRLTYQSGPAPGELADLAFNSIGTSLAVYTDEVNGCASVDEVLLLDAELDPASSIEGNLCWQVAAGDLDDLKLAVEAGPAEGRVHLALN